MGCLRFDSILVRLKDADLMASEQPQKSFDSILVRLKGNIFNDRINVYFFVSIPYWFD